MKNVFTIIPRIFHILPQISSLPNSMKLTERTSNLKDYRRGLLSHTQESISSMFFARVFCMKVLFVAKM